jgi:hypothetical protein
MGGCECPIRLGHDLPTTPVPVDEALDVCQCNVVSRNEFAEDLLIDEMHIVV